MLHIQKLCGVLKLLCDLLSAHGLLNLDYTFPHLTENPGPGSYISTYSAVTACVTYGYLWKSNKMQKSSKNEDSRHSNGYDRSPPISSAPSFGKVLTKVRGEGMLAESKRLDSPAAGAAGASAAAAAGSRPPLPASRAPRAPQNRVCLSALPAFF